MEIRTFEELIDWTRMLHANLAACLSHCSTSQEERARLLMDYLSEHEAKLEKVIGDYERQAPAQALRTYVYDYLKHSPLKPHEDCDKSFADLDYHSIIKLVIDYHDQIMALYQALLARVEIPETRDLVQSLLELEEHESMRLVRQTGRMDDL
ncbi:ATPase [Saccharospirillum salsuginis]|uniref:ATPase n=1 Tax=Saccharospirillum salsuginis TaxID=418750 RepID=A0A918K4D9_9GAMM|nr:ATPase [Saccharospirillum salsuginis]GGX48557.1 hypothetical protein GCM10007392_14500 [Saccharospirillum salsuginis]